MEAVSMDQVAEAAGVGKGTLYRRFGDKSGLAAALLDARERVLQEAILYGPPPLGPGAAAEERLTAFVGVYIDYLLENLTLIRTSETAAVGARYRVGAYRFWHRHTAILLGTTPDPEHTAHALLAALAAEHVAALLPELANNGSEPASSALPVRRCNPQPVGQGSSREPHLSARPPTVALGGNISCANLCVLSCGISCDFSCASLAHVAESMQVTTPVRAWSGA